jgi:hypothetical protein
MAGMILGALAKDARPLWKHWQRILGHPSWGLGCQINLLTIPVSGAADSGLRSGFITRYGWSGQMTNKPGAKARKKGFSYFLYFDEVHIIWQAQLTPKNL